MGKGGKTRTVRISAETARALDAIRSTSPFVFSGRSAGKPLDPSQAWRIVRAAANRAGVTKAVSPHFRRHAHASTRSTRVRSLPSYATPSAIHRSPSPTVTFTHGPVIRQGPT
jgi:integrase